MYEIDLWNRRCRRLAGEGPPTLRQGPDEKWKTYTSISLPCVGSRVLMVWNDNGHATATSPVSEILEETDSDRSFLKNMVNALMLGGASC